MSLVVTLCFRASETPWGHGVVKSNEGGLVGHEITLRNDQNQSTRNIWIQNPAVGTPGRRFPTAFLPLSVLGTYRVLAIAARMPQLRRLRGSGRFRQGGLVMAIDANHP